MKELVIIGAGPAGLWFAIQCLLRRPALKVTIYERHEVYQRSHVLRLDHWSMLLYGRSALRKKHPRLDAFYQEVTGKNLAGVTWTPGKSLFIRTNELEAALLRLARDLGATLVYRAITQLAEVELLHPTCQHFVGADGAHSKIRSSLLGDNAVTATPLRHIVEVKYQVRGPAARLGTLPKQMKVSSKLTHLAFEYVGKEKDEMVPVTLRFFLDEDVYATLPEASFKKPLSVDSPELPEALRQDIASYMQARTAVAGERYCEESAFVTKLVLSMYAAREFVVERNGKAWFLTGDAALGVPYFRAMNSGLILSSRLAQILCARSWPLGGKLSRQVALYRVHQPMHIKTEFAIAKSKDLALDVLDYSRKLWAQEPRDAQEGEDVFELIKAVDCTRSD